MNEAFLNSGDSKNCGSGKTLEVKVAIENFERADDDDGFALSYLFQIEYLNAEPVSAKEAPIEFSI